METQPQAPDYSMSIILGIGALFLIRKMSKDSASSTESPDAEPRFLPKLLIFAAVVYIYRSNIPSTIPATTPVVASNAALHLGASYTGATAVAIVAHLIMCSCVGAE